MSHKYTNYSKPNTKIEAPVDTQVVDETSSITSENYTVNETENETENDTVNETENSVENETLEDIRVMGEVVGCEMLKVRETGYLDGSVICTIPKGTKVLVDEKESTLEFYKVCTESGAEGFCMKKYILLEE